MALAKNIILITGANGGIGFELAAQLLSDASKHILLGSRSAEKGETALKELQSRKLPGSAELLVVDVNSEESIAAAAKKVENMHGRLDSLVNNAGLAVASGSLAQQMAQCFQTNATGPLLMVESFAPLLKKAQGTPRIVNVGSGQGSVTRRLDPNATGPKAVPYRASKAAMNMVTACQAMDYGDAGFKVFSYCPGFTVSNLSSFNKTESGAKPTSEGAAPIVNLLNGERDAEHGGYVHETGQYPW